MCRGPQAQPGADSRLVIEQLLLKFRAAQSNGPRSHDRRQVISDGLRQSDQVSMRLQIQRNFLKKYFPQKTGFPQVHQSRVPDIILPSHEMSYLVDEPLTGLLRMRPEFVRRSNTERRHLPIPSADQAGSLNFQISRFSESLKMNQFCRSPTVNIDLF